MRGRRETGVSRAVVENYELPHNHSAFFAPVIQSADQDGRGCVRVGCYDFLREFVRGIGHGFSRPTTTSFLYRRVSTDKKFSRSPRSNVEVNSMRRISLSFHVT